MKRHCMLVAVFVFSLFLTTWESIEAAEDLISAAGAVKFNEGTLAPNFIIEDLAGDLVKLEDFRGKVVMLNFWTTW